MNARNYSHLIFDKDAKHNKEKTVSPTNSARETGVHMKHEIRLVSIPLYKMDQMWNMKHWSGYKKIQTDAGKGGILWGGLHRSGIVNWSTVDKQDFIKLEGF